MDDSQETLWHMVKAVLDEFPEIRRHAKEYLRVYYACQISTSPYVIPRMHAQKDEFAGEISILTEATSPRPLLVKFSEKRGSSRVSDRNNY